MAVYEITTEDGAKYRVTTEDTQTFVTKSTPETMSRTPGSSSVSVLEGGSKPLLGDIQDLFGMGLPFSDEIKAAGLTAGQKLITQPLDYILGADAAPEGSWGERYAANLARARGEEEALKKEYPVASIVAPLTTAVGSLPQLGIAKGATSLAANAPRAVQALTKAAGLAGEGGAYGGLYGFSEGEGGLENRLANAGRAAEVGGLLSVLLPGAASGVSSLFKRGYNAVAPLLSRSAADQAATRKAMEIISSIADKKAIESELTGALEARAATPQIQQRAYTNLEPYKTTAEVLGPQNREAVASLAETLATSGSQEAKAAFTSAEMARESARKNILSRTRGEPLSEERAAEIIRPSLEKNLAAIKEQVTAAAKRAENPSDFVKTYGVKRAVSDAEKALTESGAYTPNAEIKGLLDTFRALPQKVSLKTLQDFRSRAGELGQQLTDKRDQSLAKALYGATNTAEQAAIKAGTVSKATGKAIGEMRGLRKTQGELYETGGVEKALKKEYGNYTLDPEKVLGATTGTEAEASRLLKALGADKVTKDAVSRAFMTKLIDSTSSASTGKLYGEGFSRFIRNNREAAAKVLGKNGLSNLEKVAADIASREKVREIAAKISQGKSFSTQGITSGLALQAALHGGASKIPFLGRAFDTLAKTLGRDREALIEQKLVQFALKPENAAAMLKAADKASVADLISRFSDFITKAVPPVFGSAAGQAAEQKPKPQPRSMFRMESAYGTPSSPAVDLAGKKNMTEPEDPLIAAVVKQESAGKPGAVSSKGATGLMQVMPETAKEIAAELGIENYDLKDPDTNMMFGQYYLKKLMNQFGDVKLALAAYNAGPGKVAQWIDTWGSDWDTISQELAKRGQYKETRNYVPGVLSKVNV